MVLTAGRLADPRCQHGPLEQRRAQGQLAIADISLWELALLHERDPADRLIGATALQAPGPLITADVKLRAIPELETLW